MMRRLSAVGATSLALSLAISAAQGQTPPAPTAQEDSGDEEAEIVVTGLRRPGAVVGDVQPDLVLGPAEVRAYGASSVAELIGALSPQTGSASRRGDGAPVILVNGRRIASFLEIRDLPAEAIARVEVFNEQLAVEYGFSPDQRVVNLILRRRFQIHTVEGAVGDAGDGARTNTALDANRILFDRGDRLALTGSLQDADAITEAERAIAPPTSGPDQRSARTLSPEAQTFALSASLTRPIDERVSATGTLRLEGGETLALLGRDAFTGAVIERRGETTTLRATGALDGMHEGWQWTTTAVGVLTQAATQTSAADGDRRTDNDRFAVELAANANGPTLSLPAGTMRMNGRLGLDYRQSDAIAQTPLSFNRAELDRTSASLRIGASAPLTSRRNEVGGEFGDITVNASAAMQDVSDFETLSGFGAGLSWSPIQGMRLSLQHESSDSAPSLEQLGEPALTTPNVTVFDVALGQTALVARTTGGVANLRGENREDLVAAFSWSPETWRGFSLIANWARNVSNDAIAPLPTLLPETELAFPGRYQRDAFGVLTGLDVRPVNLAERRLETLRVGFDFSQTFGTPARPPQGSPPWGPGLPPWGAGPPPWGSGPPPWERNRQAGERENTGDGQRRGGGGFGQRGGGQFGQGGPPPGGRWNIAVFAVARLEDSVRLRPGGAAIDLRDYGGLNGEEGSELGLEFEGGVVYRGLGLRFNGGWAGERSIRAAGGDLNVASRLTLNARAFVNFDQQFDLLAAAPFLSGGRLSLGVQNLTDSALEVRDAAGLTPLAYQDGYTTPQGRVVQLSFRKQF